MLKIRFLIQSKHEDPKTQRHEERKGKRPDCMKRLPQAAHEKRI
jgi:hypothetical protein